MGEPRTEAEGGTAQRATPTTARRAARPSRCRAGQLALELPLELPALALAPEWKDQQRLWGHAFHPMCSYLASFPAALTHAFIARYSRPGDVVLDPFSRPRHDAAPGLRRGPDRRRQRPQPVRPPADRGQGRAGDPRRGDAPGWPRCGSAWNASVAAAGSRSPSAVVGRSGDPRRPRPGRRLGRGPDAGRERRPGRGRPRVPPADARPAPVRPDDAPPRRPRRTASSPAALTGHPPRQERDLPLRADAEHVQHGARATSATSPPGPRSRRRSATSSTASTPKLDRLFRQPLPPTRGDRAPRRRPRRRGRAPGPRSARAACPTGPASS